MNFKRLLKTTAVFILLLIPFQFLAVRSANHKYQTQIETLKNEIQIKDRRIVELENKLTPPKPVSLRSVIQVSSANPLDLQNALKRAGFYSGPFDGRLTDKVVKAVKEFQKSKGLRPDGVVGKRTWQLLQSEKN